jgi:hypothetical protein
MVERIIQKATFILWAEVFTWIIGLPRRTSREFELHLSLWVLVRLIQRVRTGVKQD